MSATEKDFSVAAHIVSYNNERTIVPCIESLQRSVLRKGCSLSISVHDNHSNDETPSLLRALTGRDVEVSFGETNEGFCAPHNRACRRARDQGIDAFLLVNPDISVRADTIQAMIDALAVDPSAALITPKLLRADTSLKELVPPQIDAAGMFITPELRHFDRGADTHDHGQYEKPAYMFGGSGALLLVRLSALEEIAVKGSPDATLLDEGFFAYREDADLGWRLQFTGWRCRYEPRAVAAHVRHVTPERRASLSDAINGMGVRNRFLLQAGNWTTRDCLPTLPFAFWRNVLVFGAACTVERSSFPYLLEAYQKKRTYRQRCMLQSEKRVSAQGSIAAWFKREPVAQAALSHRTPEQTIRRVCAVIVNFNSRNRLGPAVAALHEAHTQLQGRVDLRIRIVDNASDDASAIRLLADYENHEHVSFDVLEHNLGFGGAIQAATAKEPADAYLIMNPDVIASARAIEELVRQLNRFPEIGYLAPVLTDTSGEVQHGFTVRRFPRLASVAAESLCLHRVWPQNPWTRRHRYQAAEDWRLNALLSGNTEFLPDHSDETPLIVEQPAAACVLISKSALQATGGFDNLFWPAWFEDVDFCKRLSAAGYVAAVAPTATVVHEGGYSVSVIKRRGFLKAWYPNLFRYWKKHHSSASYLGLHVIARIGLALRLLLIPKEYLEAKDSEAKSEARKVAMLLLVMILRPGSAAFIDSAIDSLKDWGSRFGRMQKHLVNAWRVLSGRTLAAPVLDAERDMPAPDVVVTPTRPILPPQGAPHLLNGSGNQGPKNPFDALGGSGLILGEHDNSTLPSTLDIQYVIDEGEAKPASSVLQTPFETLDAVFDDSFDFLVADNKLQRMRNPLLALKHWIRVIKPKGTLLIRLSPDADPSVRSRQRTTLEHCLVDYERPSSTRDLEHYLEHVVHAEGLTGTAAVDAAEKHAAASTSIPFHVFSEKDVHNLLEWTSEHTAPCQLSHTRLGSDSTWLIRIV